MNPNIGYEKFSQEMYQELVAADVVKTTNVQHNVKLRGSSDRNTKYIGNMKLPA